MGTSAVSLTQLPSAEQAYDGSGCRQRSAFADAAATLTGNSPFSMPRARTAQAA